MDKHLQDQLLAALHSPSPADGLILVVEQMQGAGKSQREIYDEFDTLLKVVMAMGTAPKDEVIRDVMDRIVGWCSPDQKLFDSYLEI